MKEQVGSTPIVTIGSASEFMDLLYVYLIKAELCVSDFGR